MGSSRPLAVDPELSGLAALSRLLKAGGARRAPAAGLTRYADIVERVGSAAAETALLGLMDACGLFAAAIQELVPRADELSTDVLDGLHDWIPLVQQYAAAPGDERACQALLAHLLRPCWQVAMGDEEQASLLEALRMVPPSPGQASAAESLSEHLDELQDTCVAITLDDAAEVMAVDAPSDVESADAPRDFIEAHLDPVTLDDEIPLIPDESPATAVVEPAPVQDDRAPLGAAGQISLAMDALLTVLIDELPQVAVAFDELAGLAGAQQVEQDVFDNALDTAIELLARVEGASESLGLAGLAEVCQHLHGELAAARGMKQVVLRAAETWRGLVPSILDYLKAPYDVSCAAAVSALLCNPHLGSPLSAQSAAQLTDRLTHPQFATVEVETRVRPRLAQLEDVSLTLPEDANPELVDALLQELPQQAEELSAAIQRLQTHGTLEDVTIAQRIAHTIKGAGNTVGVRGLAELTHQLEDILLALAKHETLPTADLSQTLSAAADCLQEMAEFLQGMGPAPAGSLNVLQRVLDWANRIDREGPPASSGEQPLRADLPAEHSPEPAQAAAPPPSERDAVTPMLRVPSSLVDDLLRLVGEAMIQNSQLHERVRNTRQEARAMRQQFDLLQQLGTELEELVDLRDLATDRRRDDDRAFDALELDQYNELHTYSRRLIEAAVDAREIGRSMIGDLGDLDDMLVVQERLNRDTQDVVLRTRMVPVKSVFPRLERSVRQTGRLTGKQVKLHLSGCETQMDSDVLSQVVDPLMHVLRNAVDHGIEAEQARSDAGKDAAGNVTVEFLRDGNNILVRCRDDGMGLDFQAIRAAAEQRGLVAPGSECSDEMLKHLILLPNFTTRVHATQTSGRGMGLDSVHSAVAALGGSLTLQSNAGQGCVVEVRLPVSLLSSHALLVHTAAQVVAITDRGLEEIRHVAPGDVQIYAGQCVFRSEGQMFPAVPMESVLKLASAAEEAPPEYRAALMLRAEGGVQAVLARSVIASRDLVVKSLGRYVPRLQGIVGATILGDGSVTPVIDLAEMLRSPARSAPGESSLGAVTAPANARQRRALVVDDSLSARRSLAQVLSDSGYKVSMARDGMEAVEMLDQARPHIIFVDLEMPRMNGMELTSHVRAHAATAKVPIVMVTSRSTEKHRAQAQAAGVDMYLTKPFDPDMLLEEAERLLGAA